MLCEGEELYTTVVHAYFRRRFVIKMCNAIAPSVGIN